MDRECILPLMRRDRAQLGPCPGSPSRAQRHDGFPHLRYRDLNDPGRSSPMAASSWRIASRRRRRASRSEEERLMACSRGDWHIDNMPDLTRSSTPSSPHHKNVVHPIEYEALTDPIPECRVAAPSGRGVEQSGQLVGLITRRSRVQIPPPPPDSGPGLLPGPEGLCTCPGAAPLRPTHHPVQYPVRHPVQYPVQ